MMLIVPFTFRLPVFHDNPGSNGASDTGSGHVDLVGPIGDAVLLQDGGKAPERVRLDDVDAHCEERRVQIGDDIGPSEHEHLVAALECGAAEIIR